MTFIYNFLNFRRLTPDGKHIKYDKKLSLHIMDSEHFILLHHTHQQSVPITAIHLFQLNSNKMEYTQLDMAIVNGHISQLILDSSNPYKFLLLYGCFGSMLKLYRGCVCDSKILIKTNHWTYDWNVKMRSLKLEGGLELHVFLSLKIIQSKKFGKTERV